jgi:glutamate synthase domain-containing protein 3
VLKRWDEAVRQFIKIMPTDYKRVLEEKKSAQIRQVVAVA